MRADGRHPPTRLRRKLVADRDGCDKPWNCQHGNYLRTGASRRLSTEALRRCDVPAAAQQQQPDAGPFRRRNISHPTGPGS